MIKELDGTKKVAVMLIYDDDLRELQIVRHNISPEQLTAFLETLVLPSVKADKQYNPHVAAAKSASGNIFSADVNVN